MRTDITPDLLRSQYLDQKLNPYQIAEIHGCNHKTIRGYLRKYGIELRKASEYNSIPKLTHTPISEFDLMTPLSIATHTMYLCEGWHTEKTNSLSFCNQDTALIDCFVKCILEQYRYTSPVRLILCYDKRCAASTHTASLYREIYENTRVTIYESHDRSRKNPIIRVCVGGRNFAREFIQNAYTIISKLT